MSRIGYNLLRDTQASLRDTGGEKSENWNSRDLLSLLVRSNMSGEQGQMSDDDVLARKPRLLHSFPSLSPSEIDGMSLR